MNTDRIVVVGAGLAGLSAALHLAGAGRSVTVIERASEVGGLCRSFEHDGHRFDAGPTVLTMPEVIAESFAAVDVDMADMLQIERIDPAYRAVYADGSVIDVGATIEATTESVRAACGPAEAQNFEQFASYARKLWLAEKDSFIDRNFNSPLDLVSTDLVRLVMLGGFGSLQRAVHRRLADDRTRRLASFQALYVGVSPKRARAMYGSIAYMDLFHGVYHARGGMSAITRAMAQAATEHGVEIIVDTEVHRLVRTGSRVTGVIAGDQLISCSEVVLTADPITAQRDLLGRKVRRPGIRRSPSCALLHLQVPLEKLPRRELKPAHHTIEFGGAWALTFEEITRRGTLMSDPSILISNPAASDSSLAPPGSAPLYVLAPTPNLDGVTNWDRDGASYRASLLEWLRGRGYGVDESNVVRWTTPSDWERQGLAGGTPFSLAHTLTQTGPFRPHNRARGVDNVVFAGAGTTPGVGVPMALISGKLAAARVAGSARARV
ncbi:MAG: phytoene desaturase family protein [Antricoccus sp.]